MYDAVQSITVEKAAKGWEVFAWDAQGEAEPIKVPTEAVVRVVIRNVRQGRRSIPVTWLRGE